MDLEVLYLAVPNLSADLGPTSSQLLWIVLGMAILTTVLLRHVRTGPEP